MPKLTGCGITFLLGAAIFMLQPNAFCAEPVQHTGSPQTTVHHPTSATHEVTGTTSEHGQASIQVKSINHEEKDGKSVEVHAIKVKIKGNEVSVSCIDPHACCEEAKKVLETLETMVRAINNGDWKTYETYVDEHCTTFDENSHKLIAGKENVLAELRAKMERYAQNGTPFVSVTIDHPYAKVTGDTAVVTLVAHRQYGGKHPFQESSKITDVFVKRDGTWKKCHYRGAWKRD